MSERQVKPTSFEANAGEFACCHKQTRKTPNGFVESVVGKADWIAQTVSSGMTHC